MIAWMVSRLTALDRRALSGMLGTAVLLVALEAWLLVLRAPLSEWRSLSALNAAAADRASPHASAAEIERLRLAVDRAEAELHGSALVRSDDDTVLSLIAALGPLAASHGVGLDVVRSGGRRVEQEFIAATFDVEARGAYLALSAWLHDAHAHIAPLGVSELALNATDGGRQVALKLRLTAYALGPAAGGGP